MGTRGVMCAHAYACAYVERFPPLIYVRACICIADQAMIRDHRSWLLWETRRKVITDKTYPGTSYPSAHPWYLRCHTWITRVLRESVFKLPRGGGTPPSSRIHSMRSCDISWAVRMGVSIWFAKTIKSSSTACNFIQNYLILLFHLLR